MQAPFCSPFQAGRLLSLIKTALDPNLFLQSSLNHRHGEAKNSMGLTAVKLAHTYSVLASCTFCVLLPQKRTLTDAEKLGSYPNNNSPIFLFTEQLGSGRVSGHHLIQRPASVRVT